nr:hypothetical protein [Moritella viscosa]SHO01247.1 unnamed protein product [Moritella viscosa]
MKLKNIHKRQSINNSLLEDQRHDTTKYTKVVNVDKFKQPTTGTHVAYSGEDTETNKPFLDLGCDPKPFTDPLINPWSRSDVERNKTDQQKKQDIIDNWDLLSKEDQDLFRYIKADHEQQTINPDKAYKPKQNPFKPNPPPPDSVPAVNHDEDLVPVSTEQPVQQKTLKEQHDSYYNPQNDNRVLRKDDTRKPQLTLKQLGKLNMYKAHKEKELQNQHRIKAVVYQPMQEPTEQPPVPKSPAQETLNMINEQALDRIFEALKNKNMEQ